MGISMGDLSLPLNRLKRIAVITCMVALKVIPALADLQHPIKVAGDLTQVSDILQATPDKGFHSILFSNYANVGRLRLDMPSSNIDSLMLMRADANSDEVIRVGNDTTFMDVKSMPGKVIIRGLAFQLAGPRSVLIAGALDNKANKSLLIEDCLIFADSLDNTFMSWLGDGNSNVTFRRTFFVSRNGKGSAVINLRTGTIVLNNNLFNFPGSIQASASENLDIGYNTINRSQFRITAEYSQLQIPAGLRINRNLIAFPPAVDAFGTAGKSVFWQTNFDVSNANVRDNRLGTTWDSFDFQPGQTDALWKTDTLRNVKFDLAKLGKSNSELWNWYSSLDTGIGMQAGGQKRPNRYNVFPGDSLKHSWNLPSGRLTAFFEPALFPKEIILDTSTLFGAEIQPAIRPLYPSSKWVGFGAFRIDSIKYNIASKYGQPILLAKDSLGQAALQTVSGNLNDIPSLFANKLLTARYYVLANSGNTMRGFNIVLPQNSETKLTANDKLVFSKVDSAGATIVSEQGPAILPNNLRSLSTNFTFETTASLSDSVTFGTKPAKSAPFSPANVFWYIPASGLLVPVAMDTVNRFTAKVPFNTASGSRMIAHLVERLSAPRGDSTYPVKGGTLRTITKNGYQLTVSEGIQIDTAQYGRVSSGYKFVWTGRDSSDRIILRLSGTKDQNVFVNTGSAVSKLDTIKPDSTGFFTISIGNLDAGKVFFLAMKFNVISQVSTTSATEGIGDSTVLEGFTSSSSGRLSAVRLTAGFLDSAAQIDTNLASARFLGGRSIGKTDLIPYGNYSLSFPVNVYKIKDSVAAWGFHGNKWVKLTVDQSSTLGHIVLKQVPAQDEFIVVIEKFAPPENYARISPAFDPATNLLSIFSKSLDSLVKPVTGYCVELKSFNETGAVKMDSCVQKPIDSSTVFSVSPTSMYFYRIRYYMGTDAITRPFQLLSGPSLKIEIPSDLDTLTLKRWRLIGFPFEGNFYNIVARGTVAPDTTLISDRDSLVTLKWNGAISEFSGIPNINAEKVKPGVAYLFASSRTCTLRLNSISGLISAKSQSVPLGMGWNFISNPYPARILTSRVHAGMQKNPVFFRLGYNANVTATNAIKYSWENGFTVLRDFEGYAVYSEQPDELVFDPFADTTGQPALKPSALAFNRTLRLELKSDWGDSHMDLIADPDRINIPFLPSPGAGVQLRVGGKSGFMIKKVANLDAVDESVEIVAGHTGDAAFSLRPGALQGIDANQRQVRLVDMKSGKIYDEASLRSIAITAGANDYRLLSGDAAFIAERIQIIQAGAPKELGLSQNFPNPFRGKTNVALDWPAWDNGERHAILDVSDMRGRSVSRTRLDDIHVGHQVVTLDASAWNPGIYLYRLTVVAGGKQARLQKRMLVSP